MKFLIIFSVIMCGVTGATWVGLAQQKHPTELNQQAYEQGRANAWTDKIAIVAPTREPQIVTERATAQERRTQSGNEIAQGVVALMCVLVFVPVSLFIYFLPSIIGKHKRNSGAIFVLNLFTGWLFIGWVIALVWACTQDSPAGAQSI